MEEDKLEILDKSCIKVDDRTICNENFKEMMNAVIQGLTDTRGEFKKNLEDYKEKVDRGLETIEKYGTGYKDWYAKGLLRFVRKKLGMSWRTLRGETAKSRLIKMGLPIVIIEKKETPYFTYREEKLVKED
ncbi:hypothetical protein J7K25_03165 [bacterium]|nr:hypothetical protein [bacterium]